MKDSKKINIKLLMIILNIFIPFIFFLCVVLIEKTNIVLYFSNPVCFKSNDYVGVINGKIMPLYLLVVLIISIVINRKETKKVKLFFLQFGIGLFVYFFFLGTVIFVYGLENRFVFTFKSPDNNTRYIVEESSNFESSYLTLKEGSYLSSTKLEYTSVNFPHASVEVSWIDNNTFNFKMIPPSWESQKNKASVYYTFTSAKKFEEIEYSEYISTQYIKTETLNIKE